ncbi:FAD-dependent oxidoreductase [Candidatus Uhrbacteria bacterium]|nr:FAD-dependent oxidoreductase [Candidatus Uhrbacteria bacterium]
MLSELQPLVEPHVTFAVAARHKDQAPFSDNLFWDTGDPYQYYRQLDSQTIILGGADQRMGTAGQTNGQADLIKFLEKFYPGPGTGTGAFDVTNGWSGSLFETQDGLPYADAHPHYSRKLFFGTGLSGNGMVMGTMIGTLLADLASGVENDFAATFSLARTEVKVEKPPRKPIDWYARVIRPGLRIGLPLIFLVTFFIPGYFFLKQRGGNLAFLTGANFQIASQLIFPLLGLYAFFFIWAQIILGSNMAWLRKIFSKVLKFHMTEGVFAFLFAVLHPTLLLMATGLNGYLRFAYVDPRLKIFAIIGEIQLVLLFVTVGTAIFMKHPWLRTRWRKIHLLNYGIFVLVWIHSWFLGSDVQTSNLKYLWVFYAVTAGLSVVWRLTGRSILSQIKKLTTKNMSEAIFTSVAKTSDIKEGAPFCAQVKEKQIALFKMGEKFYAMDNLCTHAGGPLCEGTLSGNTIECPWHGSQFDITSGKVMAGPAAEPQTMYEVRVEGDEVKVKI